MGNFARQWSLVEGREITQEFGFRRLQQIADFADRLDASANGLGGPALPVANDLRQAAVELRQLILWLHSAMGASELDAVILLDSNAQVFVSL